MTPAVALTERRRKVVRLPRACAVALRRDFAGVVAVALHDRRGCYELTAGGYVGEFAAGGVRFTVTPKYPLTYLGDAGRDFAQGRGGDATAALAGRLARECGKLLDGGLLRGYAEQALDSPTVRGRLDFAKMMRDPAAALLPVVSDEFTLDLPAHRIVKAAAAALVRVGGLPGDVFAPLARVVTALAAAGDVEPAAIRWDAVRFDDRTEHYRPAVEAARAVLEGLGGGADEATRLVNLAALFEGELTARLAGGLPGGGTVEAQYPIRLRSGGGPRTLRPDFVVRGPDGAARSAWDAKWKTLGPGGPADDDLHQVLGYAAALGVAECGLVYPGRRARRGELLGPSGLRVQVVTLPVTGDPARFDAAVERLRRRLGRSGRA